MFHQWFTRGVRARLTLPTICIHMWSVAYVSRQPSSGSAGHSGRPAAVAGDKFGAMTGILPHPAPFPHWVEHDPGYGILRDDPRFRQLLAGLK